MALQCILDGGRNAGTDIPVRKGRFYRPLSKRLFAEFFGTFWLVFGGRGSAALAAAFPHAGRSTGPAIFVEQLWLFWLAPLVGAALGGILYPLIAADKDLRD